jgi:hypothetical protein
MIILVPWAWPAAILPQSAWPDDNSRACSFGAFEHPGFVLLKHGQIEERIDPVELAGVNEAHKEVPDVGAMFGLEEVGILSMEDSFFQSLFAKV